MAWQAESATRAEDPGELSLDEEHAPEALACESPELPAELELLLQEEEEQEDASNKRRTPEMAWQAESATRAEDPGELSLDEEHAPEALAYELPPELQLLLQEQEAQEDASNKRRDRVHAWIDLQLTGALKGHDAGLLDPEFLDREVRAVYEDEPLPPDHMNCFASPEYSDPHVELRPLSAILQREVEVVKAAMIIAEEEQLVANMEKVYAWVDNFKQDLGR